LKEYIKKYASFLSSRNDIISAVIAHLLLGSCFQKNLEYNEARECYEQALKIIDDNKLDSIADVGYITNLLGGIYYSLCDYKKSIEFTAKALEILLKIFGEGHLLVAMGYNNMGLAYFSLGQCEKGISYLEKALKFSELPENCGKILRLFFNLA